MIEKDFVEIIATYGKNFDSIFPQRALNKRHPIMDHHPFQSSSTRHLSAFMFLRLHQQLIVS
jgi:hypothetical protein